KLSRLTLRQSKRSLFLGQFVRRRGLEQGFDKAKLPAMKEYARPIHEMISELPPGQQTEVRDFVEFLLAKHRASPRQQPRFDWAGALKDMRNDYTSVELQHEIARLRSEAK